MAFSCGNVVRFFCHLGPGDGHTLELVQCWDPDASEEAETKSEATQDCCVVVTRPLLEADLSRHLNRKANTTSTSTFLRQGTDASGRSIATEKMSNVKYGVSNTESIDQNWRTMEGSSRFSSRRTPQSYANPQSELPILTTHEESTLNVHALRKRIRAQNAASVRSHPVRDGAVQKLYCPEAFGQQEKTGYASKYTAIALHPKYTATAPKFARTSLPSPKLRSRRKALRS
jgi:hypothetical protein